MAADEATAEAIVKAAGTADTEADWTVMAAGVAVEANGTVAAAGVMAAAGTEADTGVTADEAASGEAVGIPMGWDPAGVQSPAVGFGSANATVIALRRAQGWRSVGTRG